MVFSNLFSQFFIYCRAYPTQSLLGLSFLLWWTGIGGKDFYLLPLLLWLGRQLYWWYQEKLTLCWAPIFCSVNQWLASSAGFKWMKICFYFHSILFILTAIIRYYSFEWHIYDTGFHTNVLYNIAQGEWYASYKQIHNWADHFTPFFSLWAIPYLLFPSIHWVTLSKVFAYILCPILFYQISREEFALSQARKLTILLGSGWMLLYAPALNSLYYEFQTSAFAPPIILYGFFCYQRQH